MNTKVFFNLHKKGEFMKKEKSKKQDEEKTKKVVKKDTKKEKKAKKEKKEKKEGLFQEVKKEMSKVHFPSRKDMVKYSVATIFFVIFFAIYFYLIELLMAFIRSLI